MPLKTAPVATPRLLPERQWRVDRALSRVEFTVRKLGAGIVRGRFAEADTGAVFKLVPVGAVTGVVGAAGGLGGFFPPLVVRSESLRGAAANGRFRRESGSDECLGCRPLTGRLGAHSYAHSSRGRR